jgi:CheY-like chemotaxis protein
MPNKDGLGATIEIKQLIPEKYQPYIIALTADIQESIKEKCEQAGKPCKYCLITLGMNGFVGKPFKPKELMEALMQASEAIAKHDTPTEVELT